MMEMTGAFTVNKSSYFIPFRDGAVSLDASVALGERGGDIGSLEPLRNMLRTVRVPGGNGE
jgi:hypothetical protein